MRTVGFLAYTRKSFIDISNSGLYLYFGEPPGSACMRVGNAEFYYCLSQPALVGFIRILDNKCLLSVSRRMRGIKDLDVLLYLLYNKVYIFKINQLYLSCFL